MLFQLGMDLAQEPKKVLCHGRIAPALRLSPNDILLARNMPLRLFDVRLGASKVGCHIHGAIVTRAPLPSCDMTN